MKISTKGRYALRMLYDLALHQEEGYVSLKDIADRQGISKKYLEQIVPLLNKTGLLRTNRGNKGGYMLSGKADDITVGDVLRATEGSLAPVACAEDNGRCENYCDCVTSFIWTEIYKATISVVSRITLKDLAERSITLEKTELECLK